MVEFEYMIINRKPKTEVYAVNVKSNGTPLGEIKYHPAWRQYVFEPFSATIYSSGCMANLLKFIKDLNKKLRLSWKKVSEGGEIGG